MQFLTGVKRTLHTITARLSEKTGKHIPTRVAAKRQLQARYDAAQTTDTNARYWQNAGAFGMTPDQMNNQAVRNTLKNRSRYNYNNDGYTQRIIDKTADEVVGKKIKINLESSNAEFNAACEKDLEKWKRHIRLEMKLRTLLRDKIRDGEALALPYNNTMLKSAVQLDLATLSCDRLTSPTINGINDNNVDGVILDSMGINPIRYQITKYSGIYGSFLDTEYTEYNADQVYHWFKQTASEQHRGIPELTSTLEINAKRRGYSNAVLSTAQAQANLGFWLKTTVTNPDQDSESAEAMDTFNLENNMVTVLPENADIGTTPASQPVDQYKDYDDKNMQEMAAAGILPHNMVKNSSQEMNYSSARFDYNIMFCKDRDVIRDDMERVILDDFIQRYVEEWAALNFAQFPMGVPDDIIISYGYEADKHIDPLKETKALVEKRKNGQITDKDYWASQGKDWREEEEQKMIEEKWKKEKRQEMGLEETENNEDGDNEETNE